MRLLTVLMTLMLASLASPVWAQTRAKTTRALPKCSAKTTGSCMIVSRAKAKDIAAKKGAWVKLGTYTLEDGTRDIYGAAAKDGKLALAVVDPKRRKGAMVPLTLRDTKGKGRAAYLNSKRGATDQIVLDAGDGVNHSIAIEGLSAFKGGVVEFGRADQLGIALKVGNILLDITAEGYVP